ncbi:LOW QUALITY PROTEIN: constitutive coactivator of peroxisome proliferator-activated receptor gamma [Spinachia spinachia]
MTWHTFSDYARKSVTEGMTVSLSGIQTSFLHFFLLYFPLQPLIHRPNVFIERSCWLLGGTMCQITVEACKEYEVATGHMASAHWCTCKDWACGGQWREYMEALKGWVEALAGIRLVSFFRGMVEDRKTQVWCSVQEAYYEIASYARPHGCMSILGQDSDFIIYDSAPYLSVVKLRTGRLTTVVYDRQRLCRAIGLTASQLPLLACLLGNDVVSEDPMQHIRNNAIATYRAPPSAIEKHVSAQILKACREKHIATGFMVYGVVCQGDCSNTLKNDEDSETSPLSQAKSVHDFPVSLPAIRGWCVYHGNPLKEPDMVHALTCSLPYFSVSLNLLWFGTGPEVPTLCLMLFLCIFDCQEFSDLHGDVEDAVLAALCLVSYIVLQASVSSVSSGSLSSEGEAVFDWKQVAGREPLAALRRVTESNFPTKAKVLFFLHSRLPALSSRAVQLGSLHVRGLGNLLGANCAAAPLPAAALMPWHSFDGRLLHSKYLLAHREAVLMESVSSCLSLFFRLREKLTETCGKRGRADPHLGRDTERDTQGGLAVRMHTV